MDSGGMAGEANLACRVMYEIQSVKTAESFRCVCVFMYKACKRMRPLTIAAPDVELALAGLLPCVGVSRWPLP